MRGDNLCNVRADYNYNIVLGNLKRIIKKLGVVMTVFNWRLQGIKCENSFITVY